MLKIPLGPYFRWISTTCARFALIFVAVSASGARADLYLWGYFAGLSASRFERWASPSVQSETLEAAKEILRDCPPADCLLVSLGINNALLDSYLRVLSGRDANYLYEIPYLRLTNISHQRQYDVLIPPRELVSHRKIVFLRSTYLGSTMRAQLKKITDHFAGTFDRDRLGAILVTNPNDRFYNLKKILDRAELGGDVRKVVLRKIFSERSGGLKHFHRYKAFDPQNPQFVENPKYQALDRQVRKHVCQARVGHE